MFRSRRKSKTNKRLRRVLDQFAWLAALLLTLVVVLPSPAASRLVVSMHTWLLPYWQFPALGWDQLALGLQLPSFWGLPEITLLPANLAADVLIGLGVTFLGYRLRQAQVAMAFLWAGAYPLLEGEFGRIEALRRVRLRATVHWFVLAGLVVLAALCSGWVFTALWTAGQIPVAVQVLAPDREAVLAALFAGALLPFPLLLRRAHRILDAMEARLQPKALVDAAEDQTPIAPHRKDDEGLAGAMEDGAREEAIVPEALVAKVAQPEAQLEAAPVVEAQQAEAPQVEEQPEEAPVGETTRVEEQLAAAQVAAAQLAAAPVAEAQSDDAPPVNGQESGEAMSHPAYQRSTAGWLGQRRAVLAVELDQGTVKILQGVLTRGELQLTAAGRFLIPTEMYNQGQIRRPEALAALLRQALNELGVRSKRAISAVGGETSVLRAVAFPRMTEPELQEALRWEAEKYLPFSLEEAIVDFKLADITTAALWGGSTQAEGQIPVILGACLRHVAEAFTQTFAQLGLRLIELEPHPLATFRALSYAEGAATLSGMVVMLHVGLEGVSLTVFKHGYPVLHRYMNGSVFPPDQRPTASTLAWARAGDLPVSAAGVEQLLQNAGRSLEVAIMQLKPSQVQVFMTGDGAGVDGLKERLAAFLTEMFADRPNLAIPLSVKEFAWDRGRQWAKPLPPTLCGNAGSWAGALGLIIRGLGLPVERPPVIPQEWVV